MYSTNVYPVAEIQNNNRTQEKVRQRKKNHQQQQQQQQQWQQQHWRLHIQKKKVHKALQVQQVYIVIVDGRKRYMNTRLVFIKREPMR